MANLLTAIWWILKESSLYLLIGFGLAGVFHVLLSRWTGLAKKLRNGSIRSVLWAALVGVPLDLCSCSVLPVALTLRRKGARPGAVYSFVISVPEVDMVSILQTNALLGPVMAVVRPVAALITALVTGVLANVFERWTDRHALRAAADGAAPPPDAATACACGADADIVRAIEGESSLADDACGHDHEEAHVHAHDYGHSHDRNHDNGHNPPARGLRASLLSAMRFGFVEFFDDLIVPLLVGVVLGGLIAVYLPAIGLDRFAGGSWIALCGMLLVAIPMYVCATASTPMALGMIAGGVSPGAALVFLLAGPATNLASVLALGKEMGKRSVALYLVCIFGLSFAAGAGLDAAIARGWVTLPAPTVTATAADKGWIRSTAAVAVLALSLVSFWRTSLLSRLVEKARSVTGLPLSTPVVRRAVVLGALIAYAVSGVFTVSPGQRAMVLRLGRVTGSNLGPGVYVHWPRPFGDRRVIDADRVRRVEMGFRSNAAEMVAVDPNEDPYRDEAWMVTANADIIDIRWSVQFRVGPTEEALRQFTFAVSDADAVVRLAGDAAIRQAVAVRGIDTLLTEDRELIESRVRDELLQPLLTAWSTGIDVVDVKLVDVHAPAPVHPAFRDVASAAERKMSQVELAKDAESTTIKRAEASATETVENARGYALEVVSRAQGDAALFNARRDAFVALPRVARLEAYLGMMDDVLPRLKKYVSLAPPEAVHVNLWWAPPGGKPPASPQAGD